MTDPLTIRELVEKSYDYIERLGRECSKAIVEEYRNAHKKFDQASLPREVGTDIANWFQKRDKNVRLNYESSTTNPQAVHLRFKGSTKDADFTIGATVSTFVQSYSPDQKNTSFVKGLTFTVNKNDFVRRK